MLLRVDCVSHACCWHQALLLSVLLLLTALLLLPALLLLLPAQ
jgi:hypothetical protein